MNEAEGIAADKKTLRIVNEIRNGNFSRADELLFDYIDGSYNLDAERKGSFNPTPLFNVEEVASLLNKQKFDVGKVKYFNYVVLEEGQMRIFYHAIKIDSLKLDSAIVNAPSVLEIGGIRADNFSVIDVNNVKKIGDIELYEGSKLNADNAIKIGDVSLGVDAVVNAPKASIGALDMEDATIKQHLSHKVEVNAEIDNEIQPEI